MAVVVQAAAGRVVVAAVTTVVAKTPNGPALPAPGRFWSDGAPVLTFARARST
jgi:hypothetical protein